MSHSIESTSGAALGPIAFALALTVFGLASACSSGLGSSATPSSTESIESPATGVGIDFGFDLTEELGADYVVTGALVPGATPEDDRRIAFVAFTTAAPNDDADGAGSRLTLGPDPTTDLNGLRDIFVMAVEDKRVSIDGGPPQPEAFSRALFTTFNHSRCIHCHGIRDNNIFPGGSTHPGGQVNAASNSIGQCGNCHNREGAAPGVEWFAPLTNAEAIDFRGADAQALSDQVGLLNPDQHLLVDGRVRWAITTGRVPLQGEDGLAGSSMRWGGESDEGPVPISFTTFRQQTLAWFLNGGQATATESILDLSLLSRSSSAPNQAADGESTAPSMTWIPSPMFVPGFNGDQLLGSIVIAFVSTASDLTNDSVGGAGDVYRAEIDVRLAMDGEVTFDEPTLVVDLVSESAAGNSGGSGASTFAAIDGSGDFVAFTSEATNLLAGGFGNNNGAGTDVFLRDTASDSTILVSSASTSNASGDGASEDPSIARTAAGGVVVAFASDATDLGGMIDTNGVKDVFVRDANGGFSIASQATSGAAATGGDSRSPSLAVRNGDEITIVFESDAINLATGLATTGTHVFLRESQTTTLLSQVGATAAGNGRSFDPVVSSSGNTVLFSSDATNLDVRRPDDANGSTDVLLVDLAMFRASGSVEGRRVSVDPFGKDAASVSSGARLATFRDSTGAIEDPVLAFFHTLPNGPGSIAGELGVTRQPLVAAFVEAEAGEPRTDFAATPVFGTDVTGPIPLTVQFADRSNGGVTEWLWEFGTPGGDVSTERNPTFVYVDAGVYTVSLTVTREGAQQSVTKVDFVNARVPLTIASITGDPMSGEIDLPVLFGATLGGDETDVEFLWDFGEVGSTPSDLATPSHTYTTVGSFDVMLSVSGPAGMAQQTFPNFITTTDPAGASFDITEEMGLRYRFQSTTMNSPTLLEWDFDFDGTSFDVEDTGVNVTKIYSSTGPRIVALRATFSPTSMDIESTQINVMATIYSGPGGIHELLLANCNACHNGPAPAGGVPFETNAQATYDSIVGQPRMTGNPCPPEVFRVSRFDPVDSFVLSIAGNTSCLSSVMATFSSSADVDRLRTWIQEGAAFD